MQLKIQRSQRMGGAFGNKVLFCLNVRAEYTPAEETNVRKYKLGSEIIYNSQGARKHLANMDAHLDRTQVGSAGERAAGLAHGLYSLAMAKMNLNISIASLGRGQHIECKDLGELMEAEVAVMNACRNLRDYLALAATFNGSIVLVDFSDGEKVHQSEGTLQLAGPREMEAIASPVGQASAVPIEGEIVSPDHVSPPYSPPSFGSLDETFSKHWADIRARYARNPTPFQMGGLIVCAVAVFPLFGRGILAGLIAIGLIGFAILLGRRRGAL